MTDKPTRILITGANRGLGLELVRQYAQQQNTRVFAACRHPEDAEELNQLAAAYPEQVIILTLDVTSDEAIYDAASVLHAHINGLDILINNAAANPPRHTQTLGALETKQALAVIHTNAVAPLMIVQSMLDLLKAGTQPRIINISTQQGSMSWKTSGGSYNYAMSKAALNMVTRCLAGDLKEHGITTICVHPGWVRTEMGGPNAPLTTQDSAVSVIALINKLTTDDNGKFFKWNGEIHPW